MLTPQQPGRDIRTNTEAGRTLRAAKLSVAYFCALLFTHCQSWGKFWEVDDVPTNQGIFAWGRSPSTAPNASVFVSVAADSAGSAYAVGTMSGTLPYVFGGQSVTGNSNGFYNVIVKYDTNGNAVWAQSATGPNTNLSFRGVSVDSSDNIYASGDNSSAAAFTFSTLNFTVNGPLLLKYNRAGVAEWGATSAAACTSRFIHVANAGNFIYAAGDQDTASCTYGSQTVTPGYAGNNVLLLKYDSAGVAQWGTTTSTSTCISSFRAVATDSFGDVYAVGFQDTCAVTYPGGAAIAANTSLRAIVIKYSSSGAVQWVFSAGNPGGGTSCQFNDIAIDKNNNIYAVGSQTGPASYGGFTLTPANGTVKGLLVRFDTTGTVLAAQLGDVAQIGFTGVATDGRGKVYVSGQQSGNLTANYGGLSVPKSATEQQGIVLKYDPSGPGEWARLPTSTPAGSTHSYSGLALSKDARLFAVGVANGAGNYVFDGQAVTAVYSAANAQIVQYR